ncbi:MAG: ribose 5-phosphate isomerase B [Syntrophomonadales bacterium]|jgi:ribose 5-phosphate isomerase B
MQLVIGSDHAGYALKEHLKPIIVGWGHQVEDVGCHCEAPVDYPDIAVEVVKSLKNGQADLGLLICGTGQGMAIAANKVPGIRAVVCNEGFSARAAREHNDANILALGARVVGSGTAELIVKQFLESNYSGGRHQRRLDLIRDIETKYLKQGEK